MSGRIHTDESKQKMSDSHKKIDNYGRFNTGHKHSEESKQKISDSNIGSNYSDETRKKISDAQPTSQEIEVFDLKYKISTTYKSISEAARALNIRQSRISMYFTNNPVKPYKGRYTFKKI
jgi:group I intron endonuclease